MINFLTTMQSFRFIMFYWMDANTDVIVGALIFALLKSLGVNTLLNNPPSYYL